jgi:hypothetical protein
MRERPILFSAEMVKAILDGHKTMTRRVAKPQPESKYSNGQWYPDRYNHTDDWCFWGKRGTDVSNKCGLPLFKCPYGQVGDRLWCKETFAYFGFVHQGDSIFIHYKASYNQNGGERLLHIPESAKRPECSLKWRPSISMPRWASRITLEITNIRVERLQEITREDIWREGITESIVKCYDGKHGYEDWHTPFKELWDSINAKPRPYTWEDDNGWVHKDVAPAYSWESNPWVWVIEFKRV